MAPQNLVIVCCHAVWLGGPTNGSDEAEWLIAPFQHGETPTFIAHAQEGLRAVAADTSSVLFFSG